uniref:non-specific serine/threonine protein kinase n=1 Tax=Macrostomum lignano TaxID=282301 RepID=A0A1I8G6F9_9PLAT
MLGEYQLIKQIGKGSYGEVWLSKHQKDRRQYVLKKISLVNASQKERKSAEQECKLLSQLKHPNIVGYRDSFELEGILYIVMAYCEGGDVYTKLKEQKGVPLPERQIVEWFVQVAMALQYMHERNILHRDLKTQNIFLTRSKIIKVGDLGIARVLDSSNDMAKTLIGTPYYMSPELFSNKPYNHKSDVWALGCCVYEMATLKHAFNARDFSSLSYKILKGRTPDMPTQYSSELLELMRSMLNLSPEKRPSVNRILRDPFIRRSIQLFLESTRRPGTAPNSASRQPLPPSPSSAQQLQRQQHQQEHVRRPPRPPTSAAPAPQPSMPPFSSPSSRRNSSSSCTSAPSTPAPAPKLPKSSSVASELQAEAVPESAAAAAASAAAATPSAVKAVVEASPRVNTAARRRRREHLGLNSPAFTNSEQYSNLQSLVLKQKQRRPKTANPRLSPRDSPKASVPAAAAVGNDAGRDSSEHEADASEKRQKRQKKSQSPVSDKTADRNGSSGGGGGGGGGSRSNSGDREQQQAAEMADLVEHMNQTLTVAAAAAAASPRSGAAASDLASASNPT